MSKAQAERVSYADMVSTYGDEMAFDFLLSIEKMVCFGDNPDQVDLEDRLQKALKAFDEVSFVL